VSGIRRVIVGTSGSPGSLRALRYAEDLARTLDATLIPVLAWTPPGGDLADQRCPCGYLRRVWAEDASRRLQDVLAAAWGETPLSCQCSPSQSAARPARSWPPSHVATLTCWLSEQAAVVCWPGSFPAG
jgi:hypothetical protein